MIVAMHEDSGAVPVLVVVEAAARSAPLADVVRVQAQQAVLGLVVQISDEALEEFACLVDVRSSREEG